METEVNESALTSSKRGNDHPLQQTVAQQDIDPYLPVFLEKPKISIFVGFEVSVPRVSRVRMRLQNRNRE